MFLPHFCLSTVERPDVVSWTEQKGLRNGSCYCLVASGTPPERRGWWGGIQEHGTGGCFGTSMAETGFKCLTKIKRSTVHVLDNCSLGRCASLNLVSVWIFQFHSSPQDLIQTHCAGIDIGMCCSESKSQFSFHLPSNSAKSWPIMLLFFHPKLKDFEEYLGLHLKRDCILIWQQSMSLAIHTPSKLNYSLS